MADEVVDQNVLENLDIDNMKVVDLKRKLKEFGLPITGNKSELVERLHSVLVNDKGKELSPDPEADILLPDNNDISGAPLNDNSSLLEDFAFSSPEKERNSLEMNSATSSTVNVMPLKKRALAQNVEENVVKVEKKRIKLNRNNLPTPKFELNRTVEQEEKKRKITTVIFNESEVSKKESTKNDVTESNKASNDDTSSKVINLATKLTEHEKINLRAKRFNITIPEPKSSIGKVAVSEKKEQVSTNSSNPSVVIPAPDLNVLKKRADRFGVSSSSVMKQAADLDVLKKRAERFGVSVSSIMKQLENQQKILDRKSKFGIVELGNKILTVEEQEKKRKRAERFGL